ncbi:MAG: hypothetical protein ACJ749_08945 [Flavisolibacter sp.]
MKVEDILAVMCRSDLGAKKSDGGNKLVDVGIDSILFIETKPVSKMGSYFLEQGMESYIRWILLYKNFLGMKNC